jgi:hypothetical protein
MTLTKTQSAYAATLAQTLKAKNADAPEGKYWNLSLNDYDDIPACPAGHHFSLDTYKCEPD